MADNLTRLGVAFAALFALAGSAYAENLQWFSNQYDNTTTLAYGMPDTDYVPVVFMCDMGDEAARLFVTHDAPDAEDGQQMSVTLSSAAGQVELSATGQFQEIDDLFHLEAEARIDHNLVRILSADGNLDISIEGETQEIPLAGASKEIGAIVAACGAPLEPNDLEIRITNKVDTPVVSVLFSERGVNDFDGDTYGNQVLAQGDSTHLVIPDGKLNCTYDLRAEFDEEEERDPFEGSQNLCENEEFVITE